MSKSPPLVPGEYYHIFNRGDNRENIFNVEKNYHHFPKLYAKYVSPIADTFAYCLLRNHFHFLIRIKEELDSHSLRDLVGLNPALHFAFSRLFNAYTKSINIVSDRRDSLFEKSFKWIQITSDAHLLQLVAYIHKNPQNHSFVGGFQLMD
jgi:REP element-mobilizing transposase RayT